MSKSRYKIIENGQPHFLTCTVINWVPVFDNDIFKMIIIDSLKFLIENSRIELYAFVVMEHHIHLIVSADQLNHEMASFKSYTARICLDKLKELGKQELLKKFEIPNSLESNRIYHFWIEGYHPELIQGSDMMRQKANYIHENPVRAGYVKNPKDWIYSSFWNYHGKNGLINIKTEW